MPLLAGLLKPFLQPLRSLSSKRKLLAWQAGWQQSTHVGKEAGGQARWGGRLWASLFPPTPACTPRKCELLPALRALSIRPPARLPSVQPLPARLFPYTPACFSVCLPIRPLLYGGGGSSLTFLKWALAGGFKKMDGRIPLASSLKGLRPACLPPACPTSHMPACLPH